MKLAVYELLFCLSVCEYYEIMGNAASEHMSQADAAMYRTLFVVFAFICTIMLTIVYRCWKVNKQLTKRMDEMTMNSVAGNGHFSIDDIEQPPPPPSPVKKEKKEKPAATKKQVKFTATAAEAKSVAAIAATV